MGLIGKRGTLATLNEELSGEGYFYQYKIGQKDYHITGHLNYKNREGKTLNLVRIKKGEPARRTGNLIGLIRTAQSPDTYEIRGKIGKRR